MKTCKHENCTGRLFSKGECKFHANIRYAKKRRAKLRAKKSKPRLSRKPTERHQAVKKLEYEAMREFFAKQLKDYGTYEAANCKNCGAIISEFQPGNVAHIISKGALPAARTDPANMVVVCLQCHQQMDFVQRYAMNTDFVSYITEREAAIKRAYSML